MQNATHESLEPGGGCVLKTGKQRQKRVQKQNILNLFTTIAILKRNKIKHIYKLSANILILISDSMSNESLF